MCVYKRKSCVVARCINVLEYKFEIRQNVTQGFETNPPECFNPVRL